MKSHPNLFSNKTSFQHIWSQKCLKGLTDEIFSVTPKLSLTTSISSGTPLLIHVLDKWLRIKMAFFKKNANQQRIAQNYLGFRRTSDCWCLNKKMCFLFLNMHTTNGSSELSIKIICRARKKGCLEREASEWKPTTSL